MTQVASNPPAPFSQKLLRFLYVNRRRLATGSAMMLAIVLGYYAVAGDNGLTVYKRKRIEDKQLARQIDELKQENARLQEHVNRLQTDPDAIEHEAREKLHYTRPGEVIYTMTDSPSPAPSQSQPQASPSSSNQ